MGASLVVLALVTYEAIAFKVSIVSDAQSNYLQGLGYLTLTIVLVGLAISAYGIIKLLSLQRDVEGSTSLVGVLSRVITTRRYSMVVLACSVLYAVFFSIVSGILVFQPAVVFSRDYGVAVPSVNVVTCCGSIGQVPQFVIYVTDHVGVLLVPMDIVIMFAISLLVGFNAGMSRVAYDNGKMVSRKGWIGLLGAGFGLFTACPTCAGFFLSSLFGISGAFSIILGFSWLQGALIIGGLIGLISGPVLTGWKLASENNCQLPRK
jgi:hypothetical protein